jgi:hypothetical protein
MRQPKVLILRDQLGSRSWFTVWIDGIECSTPIDTLPEAVQWIKTMADADRVGVYRVSNDLTEVLI